MMRRSLSVLFLLSLLGGCADPTRSRQLNNPEIGAQTLARQVCSNCHGPRGVSVSPLFPNLAAQQPAYMVAELTSFREQHRRDPEGFEYMWGISRHLSDAQIAGLAEYYAAQPPARAAWRPAESALVAGRTLFTQGAADRGVPACASCHGAGGEGMAAFPRLAGQHADYVERELGVFQRSADERPQGATMNQVAHRLTADDITAVARFVESL